MFFPRCGQERVSHETSFCSRCGFLLTGAAELLLTDGVPAANSAIRTPQSAITLDSPRARGVKFGIFMMLLTFVIAPIIGMISVFGLGLADPWPMGIVIFLLGGGSLLRIVHALMFESKQPGAPSLREKRWARWNSETKGWKFDGRTGEKPNQHQLPIADTSDFIPPAPIRTGRWLDTCDLEPQSVTEQTTRQLSKEDFSE